MASLASPVRLLGAVGLLLVGCNTPRPLDGAPAVARGPVRHVVLVTVDGLMPDTVRDADALGLAIPTLRALAADGAATPVGARSVFPSVTYPAHATIVTGVAPGQHGIVSNRAPDGALANLDGWRWYAEDLRVPALWDEVERAGGTAALVNWPVTVGARASIVVPELWRAGTTEDQKLVRALSTPGVLEATAARFPGFWARFAPPNVADEAGVDVAVHVLETARPSLLLLHVWQVDDAQHAAGPRTPGALRAIEAVDAQLARLIEACKRAGMWEHTVVVIASDHGFRPIRREVHLGALLVEEGVLVADARGRIANPTVRVMSDGGIAAVYAEGGDAGASAAALARFRARLERERGRDAAGGGWVGRILEPAEVAALGGDPAVAFAIEAAPDAIFEGGLGMPVVRARVGGSHGWSPEQTEMNATLIFGGPPIAAQVVNGASLVDVAPTVGAWLGAPMTEATGNVLPIGLRGR